MEFVAITKDAHNPYIHIIAVCHLYDDHCEPHGYTKRAYTTICKAFLCYEIFIIQRLYKGRT